MIREATQKEKEWIADWYHDRWNDELFHNFDEYANEHMKETGEELTRWDFVSDLISFITVQDEAFEKVIIVKWSEVNALSMFEIEHDCEWMDGYWEVKNTGSVRWTEFPDSDWRSERFESRKELGT